MRNLPHPLRPGPASFRSLVESVGEIGVALMNETCWACGRTEQYDTAKHHRPFHWHSSFLADGLRMLCPVCRSLLRVQGRVSHLLIRNVLTTQKLVIDDRGHIIGSGSTFPSQFSIDARPTPALFFGTEEGAYICVYPDGIVEETEIEEIWELRYSPISSLRNDPTIMWARSQAIAYAEANFHLIQSHDVYFD